MPMKLAGADSVSFRDKPKGGGGEVQVPQQAPVNIPEPLPYMAQENVQVNTIIGTKGSEPIYYSGRPRNGNTGIYDALIGDPLKNWGRRTFGAIFDPYKVLPSPTKEEEKQISERSAAFTELLKSEGRYNESLFEKIAREGINFGLETFGITPEEFSQGVGTVKVASEGKQGIGALTGTAVRAGGEALKTAIFSTLGAPEWVMRNGAAVLSTLDELADKAAGKDADYLSDEHLDPLAKYNKALEEKINNMGILGDVVSRIPLVAIADNLTDEKVVKFTNVLKQLTPVEYFKDAARLLVNIDNLNLKENEAKAILSRNLRASSAIYSLFYDETVKQNFIRRYKDGESPQKLIAEYQNPAVELAAGILYDPTTFISAPAKGATWVDEGYQVIKTGALDAVGRQVRDNLMQRQMMPEIKAVMRDLQGNVLSGTLMSKPEAMAKVEKTIDAVLKGFQATVEDFGFAALTQGDKYKAVAENFKDFAQRLAFEAQKLQDPMEGVTSTFRALRTMATPGIDKAAYSDAFFTLAHSPIGEMAFSPKAMQIGAVLNAIDGALPEVKKMVEAGDTAGLAKVFADYSEKGLKKLFPSVDEMLDAVQEVAKNPDAADDVKKVAAQWDKLPPLTKAMHKANAKVGQKYAMSPMKFFATVYFDLNRFAYPIRNVLSTFPVLLREFGFKDALEIEMKALTLPQMEKAVVNAIESTNKQIEDLLGVVPGAAKRGTTSAGEFTDEGKKLFGVIRGGAMVATSSEQLMSSMIVLKSAQREFDKILKKGLIPKVDDLLNAGMTKVDADRLADIARHYKGDPIKAVTKWRETLTNGDEAWRRVEMPDGVKEYFRALHLDGEVAKFLEEEKDLNKFVETMSDYFEKVAKTASHPPTELQRLGDDIPEKVKADYSDTLEVLSPEGVDNFMRMIVSGNRAREKAKAKTYELITEAGKRADALRAEGVPVNYDHNVTKWEGTVTTAGEHYDKARGVMNEIKQLRRGEGNFAGLSPEQMWQEAGRIMDKLLPADYQGARGMARFSEANPKYLGEQEMKDIIFHAEAFNRFDSYAKDSADYLNAAEIVRSDLARVFGLQRAEELDGFLGVDFGEVAESVRVYNEAMASARIDVLSLARKRVKATVNLSDMHSDWLTNYGYNQRDPHRHLFEDINRYLKSTGKKPYATYAQVDWWIVHDVALRHAKTKGLVPDQNAAVQALQAGRELVGKTLAESVPLVKQTPPLIAEGKAVSTPRIIHETLEDFTNDFEKWLNTVTQKWGQVEPSQTVYSPQIEKALGDWATDLGTRRTRALSEIEGISSAFRDALLYDYRKQNFNVALAYLSPFHYFHQKTANAWLQNISADPKWGAAYLDYKEYAAQRAAGLPDWWKQNIEVGSLLGMDADNPIFFNIEASVNPLYGLTAEKFDNPQRRADWFSSVMDDMSKVIPGMYAPLQWLTAAELHARGEGEASRAWLGRLIPFTRPLKTALNAFGFENALGVKYNEFDPIVALVHNGLDPFEEKRAARYLATMEGEGYTREQLIDAAYSRNEIWDQAVQSSLGQRAGAEAMSFFLGVGLKPRNENDVMVDQFYQDYRKLVQLGDVMPADQYRQAWVMLGERYPFMDALLISRKGNEADRETAFSYNVVSRIPAGDMSDIAEFVGIEPYMIEDFYANKGDLSKFSPADKKRWMAAMEDMAVMLKLPDGSTKEEWNYARQTYAQMNTELEAQFGEDINDKINMYFDTEDKEQYLKLHPEVEMALQAKTAMIYQTPVLSAYYGGIEQAERYHYNIMYGTLEKEFGKDIQEVVDYYYWLKDNEGDAAAKAYFRKENLGAYYDRKNELEGDVLRQIIEAGSRIPEGKSYTIRPEFIEQVQQGQATGIQEQAYDFATPEPQTWADFQDIIPPALQQDVQDYLQGEDGALTSKAKDRLDYIARQNGYKGWRELLQAAGVSLNE